jgi:hypothetical protein
MSWRNGRSHVWRLLAGSITAIGLMLVPLMPTLANATPAQGHKSDNAGHFKVDKPDAALTASWWQEFVAIAGSNSLDRCDVGTGKIVFLAGTTGGTATRSCSTDKAKTFLVPLINVECSEAEGNGTTFEELRECAKGFADDFTDLTLVVDGQAVSNLDRLRVQAESTFTSVDNNVFGIPAATDSKFAADGYWALVKLTPGEHTITFGGSYPPGDFTTLVTYDLFVKK